jgi:hypothetical protein
VTGRHSNQLNYQSSIERAKIDDFPHNSKPFSKSDLISPDFFLTQRFTENIQRTTENESLYYFLLI